VDKSLVINVGYVYRLDDSIGERNADSLSYVRPKYSFDFIALHAVAPSPSKQATFERWGALMSPEGA
jgi:hypothetical protein